MVGIIKGDFAGRSPDRRPESLRSAFEASQRLENGYHKYHIQNAIRDRDMKKLAHHAMFLDPGYNRYVIEKTAREFKK